MSNGRTKGTIVGPAGSRVLRKWRGINSSLGRTSVFNTVNPELEWCVFCLRSLSLADINEGWLLLSRQRGSIGTLSHVIARDLRTDLLCISSEDGRCWRFMPTCVFIGLGLMVGWLVVVPVWPSGVQADGQGNFLIIFSVHLLGPLNVPMYTMQCRSW